MGDDELVCVCSDEANFQQHSVFSVGLSVFQSAFSCEATVRRVYTVPVDCKGGGNLRCKILNDGIVGLRLLLVPPVVSIFLAYFGFGLSFSLGSATEPEVNPKPYSTSQGANQDIRALKMPYLTNQEGLNHEANIYGFYTQEEVQANWNWAKIFTEQEVMNFTTQRFLSRSICEYPTLEGDLSSGKERPEAKPIIGVKRSLSAFQKAQDQEKWPRNYEVMIQSPKPVKPVLHLPQLEANRFNQLQTRHWRPGDHLNQSGDILVIQEEFYKLIPCTSNHWIRRILIYSNLPYLEQTDINVQQLFPLQFRHDLSTFQAVNKVPRKLTYPLKPSRFKKDQILYLEPKSHKRLQRLLGSTIFINSWVTPPVPTTFLVLELKLLNQEAMVGETHGHCQMAKENQHLTALQEVDLIAQLRKRKKAQGQRPQPGERRFGDAPEAIRPNQKPTVFYDQNQPIEVPKTMEEKKFVSQDTLARHKEKPDKLIFQEKAKVSPILDKFVCKSSPTSMSHLSLSKNDKTGPEVKKDTISKSFLDLKEGLNHEANIYGFYTQEEVQANWNWAKIFTEQEVMNFTTQRFLSRSICEYPTLEEDLSSSKERPEAKPIIGVKRSLLAFQKAQDQEKWPRNYEVMIQSPKPVKPVLHLPQLEANRRILIYSNLPYLEQTDINVQQLFPLQFRHDLSTFQAVKKVPRKLTYPLKPSRFKKDQILYLEPKSHKRLQRLNVRTFVSEPYISS
ncbi:hypothetical protein IGI04_022533 [Brassica rapa subsp. trilocularis]|uniref:TPX2 central domain-containing protein n=1 Tax=Brassica rapa subsp. trilocularis TaxID=1813537 RepID=A0ABQ7M2L8_BRACM|nr:hypothetical protein IGI04_022533 [Brassica rapa subsp. trilocularis]